MMSTIKYEHNVIPAQCTECQFSEEIQPSVVDKTVAHCLLLARECGSQEVLPVYASTLLHHILHAHIQPGVTALCDDALHFYVFCIA